MNEAPVKPLAASLRSPLAVGLGLLAAVSMVALVTAIAWFSLRGGLADIVMLYLLGVVLVAIRFGYAPSLLASALSVAAFDYLFTVPYFSFAVNEHFVLTLIIMLVVAVVISHLTESIRRSEAAARERERETQTERLRNAVLSSVSHDLRTPLAVVMGAATALIEGDDELPKARRREYLTTISDEASRLNRLVRNLLDMTTLEAGAMRARKEWHLIEEVVGVALNRLEEPLQSRPVKVNISAEASRAPFDASLVEQVFINLVENAIKHTPSDAGVEISARRVNEGVEVQVDDQGPGVPPGKEDEIFEKFHRDSTAGAGMGIGLTICRGIVATHGGRIWCENRSTGGASFHFVLPFDGQEPPPIPVLPEALGDP
jgi:two-component system sensor histidine kinase KdpD